MSEMIRFATHRMEGHELTWAGNCPWTGRICFGSDAGEVLFEPLNPGWPIRVPSGDVVNGIAFDGDLVAISTPSDVTVFRRQGDSVRQVAQHAAGAHGIVAGAGGFLAPLGPVGVLLIDSASTKVMVASSPMETNCYAAAFLSVNEAESCFLLACRDTGLHTIAVSADFETVRTPVTYELPEEGTDVVGVCSLQSTEWPFAAAAISIDGKLLLFRNALTDVPEQRTFPELDCRAYGINAARGHLILHTSDAVLAIPNFARDFLAGEDSLKAAGGIPIRDVPMEASDINVVNDETLVLVNDGQAATVAIEEFIRGQATLPGNVAHNGAGELSVEVRVRSLVGSAA
jgi:hypothetical protein